MMSFTIIIGSAAVLFILGTVFLLKGISLQDQSAVPISNPKEIQEIKKSFFAEKDRGSSEAGPKPAENKAPALRLDQDEPVKPKKLNKQQQIDQWMEENRRLKNQINDQKTQYKQLEQSLEDLRKEYQEIKGRESETVEKLKSQVARLETEKSQATADEGIVEELKGKCETFEKQCKENEEKIAELNASVEKVTKERDDLLNAKNQSVDKGELDLLNYRLEGSIRTIEVLKGENKTLQESNDELKKKYEEIEAFNKQLVEKEKLIHYELSKNRAQAVGLEKLCEDFKQQIESMSVK